MSATETNYALIYDDAPPSINHGGLGARKHWSAGAKEKRRWEGIYQMLLMARRVPRGMSSVYVDGILEFADNRRRDPENYRPAITKPLADALVKGGWLADDTQEFFEFGRLKIVSGVTDLPQRPVGGVRVRLTLVLEPEYAEPQ